MKRLFFSVFLIGTIHAQGITVADSNALVDLYNSTGGASWTNKTGWLTTAFAKDWFGVTRAGNRVAAIDLSNNNLVGTIPSTIGNLSNLNSLQLFNNKLTGTIPAGLATLLNLTSLGLEQNQLSGQIPAAIGNIGGLTQITLSDNLFTDSIPVTFKNLSFLQKLEIQNNRLDVLPKLNSIGTLTTLKVEGNRFTFEDIVPNVGVATFSFSPQDSALLYATVNANEASKLRIPATVGGSGNLYQWKKNNVAIGTQTQDTLKIDSVTITDAASYNCDITNPGAAGLTLRRKTQVLQVQGVAPEKPTGLTALGVSTSRINVSWNAATGVVTKYRVFRSLTAASGYAQIDSTIASVRTYANTGLNSKTIYFYRVASVGNFGISLLSDSTRDTTFNATPVRAIAIADTSYLEGFGKTFRTKLSHNFTDADDATLTFTAVTTPAQITATISSDTLYLKSVAGFSSAASVIIRASDGQFTVSDTFIVTQSPDNFPPVITSFTTAATSDANTALPASCNVTDNSAVGTVRLIYQRSGSVQDSVTMTAAGNVYSAQVPASAITTAGVIVFVKALDPKGNLAISDTQSTAVNFTTLSPAAITGADYASGIPSGRWRLISVPGDLTDKKVSTLVSNPLATEYTSWDVGGGLTTNVANGEAVWFIHRLGANLPITVTSGKTNPVNGKVITLQAGWNLIGNPFPFVVNIALNQTQFYGPLSYTGSSNTVAGWSGVLTQLNPFGGYAIYNRGAARTITIRASGVTVPKAIAAEFELEARAEGNRDGIRYGDWANFIRVINDERPADFDAPEPIAAEEFISVGFARDDKPLREVYYGSGENGFMANVNVLSKLSGGTMHFDLTRNSKNWEVKIFDYDENRFVELGSALNLHSGKYTIVAGNADFVNNNIKSFSALPKQFLLGQNYPNPFNPTTQIKYTLAQTSKIRIEIFNTLGQRVTTLIGGEVKPTGNYEVTWNGRDELNRAVGSGLFFYRLTAESLSGKQFVQTRKMLLVK